MKEPTVSIVTIFLNAERFIAEAIESVLAQTCDQWELLLVDDGSTDRGTTIARDYATRFPGRIFYHEHDAHSNRGMSASRNLGIRRSHAPFIAFLDADDVWLPNKLERQVAILESQSVAMVYGASQYWHGWTGRWEDTIKDHISNIGVPPDSIFQPPALLALLLGGIHTPCPSDILVRRDALDRVGGFEESFIGLRQLYEDQAFLSKIYLDATVFVSNECWDRYRIHDDSCDSVALRTGRHHEAHVYFLRWLQDYIAARQVGDEIRDSLNSSLEDALQARRWASESNYSKDDSEQEFRCLQWWLRVADGNGAALDLIDRTGNTVCIEIKRAMTRIGHDIQLNVPRFTLQVRRSYQLSFMARAESVRSMNVGCSLSYPPWDNLGLYHPFNLTSEWQEYSVGFCATDGSINARIHFDVGEQPGSVAIRNVRLLDMLEKKFVHSDQPPVPGNLGLIADSIQRAVRR
jgi:glycosyltransferase involved in cell wall biosynthesis